MLIAGVGALALLVARIVFFFPSKHVGIQEEGTKSRSTDAKLTLAKPEKPALLVSPFDSHTAQTTQQAWANYLGKSGFVETNSIGMKLVLIPPGEFRMGSAQRKSR